MGFPSTGINIFFAIVIYNKECSNSPSVCYALKKKDSLKIIVADNSTIVNSNREFCNEHGVVYISMEGNKGLSKAYNQVLSHIGDRKGYIIWADDDTQFPDHYTEIMLQHMLRGGLDVGFPLVKTGEDIYSPTTIDANGIPKKIHSLNELGDRISGINSGMMVNLELYKNYQYDEKMFLDFIDHDLCAYCYENGKIVGYTEKIQLQQNAFFSSRFSLKKVIRRRNIFRKDFIRFCNKHHVKKNIAMKKIIHGEIAIMLRYIKQLLKGAEV